jgi:hypothetical protein
MKKLFILIAVTLFSCSKEESDCVCKQAKMTTINNSGSYFYISNLPLNCDTNYPNMQQLPSNYVFIRCVE